MHKGQMWGICGAKLYFSDRTIQHAGVTIGTRGLAGQSLEKWEKKNTMIEIISI